MSAGTWESTSGEPRSPRALVVYEAVVLLDSVERSEIRLRPGIGASERRAIEREPEWTAAPWRGGSAASDRGALMVALEKMKALLDYRSELGDLSPGDIRDALRRRFPHVATASAAGGSVGFKRYPVEVSVDDDGAARWGFITPEEGRQPPGIDPQDVDGELRILLQNLVRADILARLQGETGP